MRHVLAAVLLAITGASSAVAHECGAGALGTSRVQNFAPGDRVGSFHYTSPPFAPKEIALTFDDGPNPKSTERILDVLKRECVRATFFVVGRRAKQTPDLVRRIAAEGHTIGTHTWSHRDLKKVSPEVGRDDIEQTIEFVRTTTGRAEDARLFRYPNLSQTPEMNRLLADEGQIVMSTDISPKDWKGDPPAETLERLKRLVKNRGRGIVMLHDAQANTADFLPDFLAFLKAEGYRVVALQAGAQAGQ